jgi:hypothetical protein
MEDSWISEHKLATFGIILIVIGLALGAGLQLTPASTIAFSTPVGSVSISGISEGAVIFLGICFILAEVFIRTRK